MKSQEGYLTRKSGSWLGHFSRWVTDHATGQRKRQQRAFKLGPVASMTKTKARDALRARIVKEMGITGDSRMTLNGFIEQRWKPNREGNWRDSTAAFNRELLKYVVARFGDVALEDLDRVEMQQWLSSLAKKYSSSVVRHCRIFLRSILAEATEEEYIRRNPALKLVIPKKLKAVKKPYLSMDEIKALLKAAQFQRRDHTLLTVILVAALRPSELLALRWKCIDLKTGILTLHETVYRGVLRPFTKTTEEGETPRLVVPKQAVAALGSWFGQTEYNGEEDFIFPNADGGFLLKENYSRRVLNELAKLAGIPRLNFQILRRSVATHAQHLGSLKDVQTLMRHKKAETTSQHYIQVIESSQRSTAEALADKMLAR